MSTILTQREFLKRSVPFMRLLALFLLLSSSCILPSTFAAEQRPNVVFILLDNVEVLAPKEPLTWDMKLPVPPVAMPGQTIFLQTLHAFSP